MVEGIWEGIWEGGTFRGGGSCGVGVVGGCSQRAGVASKDGVVYFLQVASSYPLSSLLKRDISLQLLHSSFFPVSCSSR